MYYSNGKTQWYLMFWQRGMAEEGCRALADADEEETTKHKHFTLEI